MKTAFRCDAIKAVMYAPVEVCSVRYRSLRMAVARQNIARPVIIWNSTRITSTDSTNSERYHFRNVVIIAWLNSWLNAALAWFSRCQQRKMSTIKSAEVPCTILRGMGFGVVESGLFVSCLRIAHSVAKRAEIHSVHQIAVSPFEACNR